MYTVYKIMRQNIYIYIGVYVIIISYLQTTYDQVFTANTRNVNIRVYTTKTRVH